MSQSPDKEAAVVADGMEKVLDTTDLKQSLQECTKSEEQQGSEDTSKNPDEKAQVENSEVTVAEKESVTSTSSSVTTKSETSGQKKVGASVVSSSKSSTMSSSSSTATTTVTATASSKVEEKSSSSSTTTTTGTKAGGAPLFQFTNPALKSGATSAKEILLYWCQCRTRDYQNIKIENFSSSWSNGLAFCALVHHYYPDAFDYQSLDPKNRRKNFDLAFKVAEEKADIYPLLDTEDMLVMGNRPDWKCVFTYVQSMYRKLKDRD